MRHNLTALDVFAEIVKMMNQTGMWDAGFAHLSHGHRIHSFRPTRSYHVFKILPTPAKLLELSGYHTESTVPSLFRQQMFFAQSVGVVEYTDCISAER